MQGRPAARRSCHQLTYEIVGGLMILVEYRWLMPQFTPIDSRSANRATEQKRVGDCLSVLQPTDLEVEGWIRGLEEIYAKTTLL